MLHSGKGGRKKGGRLDNDPGETRYGCFLPDLTGLARDLSIASLPIGLYQDRAGMPQAGTNRRGRWGFSPRWDFHHGGTEEGRKVFYRLRREGGIIELSSLPSSVPPW